MSGNGPAFGTIVQWAQTLREPLLTPHRRAQLETALNRAHAEATDEVQLFFAGFISGIVLTLPERDVWRSLASRYRDATVGEPPAWDGAMTPAGGRFGTWRDAVDLTPLVYASPFDDPNLIALVDDLSPQAAAIVAAAGCGWTTCLTMIRAVHIVGAPGSGEDQVVEMFSRQSFADASDRQHTLAACQDACRWVLHRRRGYVGSSDDWPEDAAHRWAWRATRTGPVKGWRDDDITAEVELFRIHQSAPQDRGQDQDLVPFMDLGDDF